MDDIDEFMVMLKYPGEDIDAIETLVRESDFFTTLNASDPAVIGRIIAHHDPRNDIKFQALLDRNVYTDLTTLAEHSSPTVVRDERCLRASAALLAFLQIAEITIDYAACLYEYADTHSGEDAIREIRSFGRIDNADPAAMIDFALGRRRAVHQECVLGDPPDLAVGPEEFEKKLWKFRISYTITLKIAQLASESMTGEERMLALFDWMHDEFMFGSAGLLFANRLFCPNPIRRMLKGADRKSLRNAAWDICLIQDWRSRARNAQDDGVALLLCTRDKAMKDIARSMLEWNDNSLRDYFINSWGRRTGIGKRIFARYEECASSIASPCRRQISIEDQKAVLSELERELGV